MYRSEHYLLPAVLMLSVGITFGCGGKSESNSAPNSNGATAGTSGNAGAGGGSGGAAGAAGGAAGGSAGAGGGAAGAGGQAGTAGSSGTGGGNCSNCKHPPAKPSTAPTGDGSGVILAANRLLMGDLQSDGTPDENAWRTQGYDIDGYDSKPSSTYHCKPNGEDAYKREIQVDGEGGIDNSFGKNIVVGLFGGFGTETSQSINRAISEGKYTILLQIDKLGHGKNYLDLRSSFYVGSGLNSPPNWDGSDRWPVMCEHMNDCQQSGTKQINQGNESKILFAHSYVSNGTWVSSSSSDSIVYVPFAFSDAAIGLELRHAVITAQMTGTGAKGVISGIISTEQFVQYMKKLIGRIDPSYCEGPTTETILNQIRAASDIMIDGTQDPNKVCNGISAGIAFEMRPAKLGKVLDAAPAEPDPCSK